MPVNDTNPATTGFAITASDSTQIKTRAIYVGTGGNLNVQFVLGNSVLLSNVQAGSVLPLSVLRVMSTNTTASDLVGLL